jgi:hypothetical protein
MKNLKLFSILMGVMLFLASCSVEPYEGTELKATNVKASNDDNGCETGFAVCAPDFSNCFLESGFKRWGWSIGPYQSIKASYSIYAGAGKCDTSKGEEVGTVELNYDGATAVVNFIAKQGYVFKETHVYVGNTLFPMKTQGQNTVPTVAPGQYPSKHGNLDNVTMDSHTIDGLSGKIYLIAHSVVCAKATAADTDDD